MNREQLLALRKQILDATVPLVLESESLGDDKFSLMLRLIHAGNASGEVYQKAYEAAQAIQDKEERLSALLGLLDEVDIDLGEAESLEGNDQAQAASEQAGGSQPESIEHTSQQ